MMAETKRVPLYHGVVIRPRLFQAVREKVDRLGCETTDARRVPDEKAYR